MEITPIRVAKASLGVAGCLFVGGALTLPDAASKNAINAELRRYDSLPARDRAALQPQMGTLSSASLGTGHLLLALAITAFGFGLAAFMEAELARVPEEDKTGNQPA